VTKVTAVKSFITALLEDSSAGFGEAKPAAASATCKPSPTPAASCGLVSIFPSDFGIQLASPGSIGSVADLSAGLGLIAGRWQITFTQVRRTREFKTQQQSHDDFGSVSLSRAF
jgi:hypothetical protein